MDEQLAARILSFVPRSTSLDYFPAQGAQDVDLVQFVAEGEGGSLGLALPLLPRLYSHALKRWRAAREEEDAQPSRGAPTPPDLDREGRTARLLADSACLLLLANPFHYSAWNARKRAALGAMGSTREEEAEALSAELRLSALVLSRHPKSGEGWAHRMWALARMQQRQTAHCASPEDRRADEGRAEKSDAMGSSSSSSSSSLDSSSYSSSPARSGGSGGGGGGGYVCACGQCARLSSDLAALGREVAVCDAAVGRRARCYPAWTHRGRCVRLFLLDGGPAGGGRGRLGGDGDEGEAGSVGGVGGDGLSAPPPFCRSRCEGVLAALLSELSAPASLASALRASLVPSDYSRWHHRALVIGMVREVEGRMKMTEAAPAPASVSGQEGRGGGHWPSSSPPPSPVADRLLEEEARLVAEAEAALGPLAMGAKGSEGAGTGCGGRDALACHSRTIQIMMVRTGTTRIR